MMPLSSKTLLTDIMTFTSGRMVDFAFHDNRGTLNTIQKEFLSSQIDFDLPEPVHIRQVHGDRIIVVDENYLQRGPVLEEADGLITKISRLPLAVRSADCLPVFLYDKKEKGIGLVHVGWRGCQKNISGQAVELMIKQWQSNPEDIQVVFGPAIRSCCYKVGREFQEYFSEGLIPHNGYYYFDLPKVCLNQLTSLGVKKENIFDREVCTCCDKNYFSVRREKELAGRMISLMMMNIK